MQCNVVLFNLVLATEGKAGLVSSQYTEFITTAVHNAPLLKSPGSGVLMGRPCKQPDMLGATTVPQLVLGGESRGSGKISQRWPKGLKEINPEKYFFQNYEYWHQN